MGHSFGGLVARLALVLPSFPVGRVHTLFTLGSPHQAPPVAFDRSLATFYLKMGHFWQTERPRPVQPLLPKNDDLPNPSTEENEGDGMLGYVMGMFGFGGSGDANATAAASAAANATATDVSKDAEGEKKKKKKKDESPAAAAAATTTTTTTTSTCDATEDSLCVETEAATGAAAFEKEAAPKKARPLSPRREKARKLYEDASAARQERLRFANMRLGNVSVVSLGGGRNDVTVMAPLTRLDGLMPPKQGLHIPDVGSTRATTYI